MLLGCAMTASSSPACKPIHIGLLDSWSFTYGHRLRRTRVPVRSLLDKPQIGPLVLRLETTWESGAAVCFCIFLLRCRRWTFEFWTFLFVCSSSFANADPAFLLLAQAETPMYCQAEQCAPALRPVPGYLWWTTATSR